MLKESDRIFTNIRGEFGDSDLASARMRGCWKNTSEYLKKPPRELLEEISGHRERRFLLCAIRIVVERTARYVFVLGGRRNTHFPRRQSAYEIRSVLGMGYPRSPNKIS